jgi:hypothetical protein
MSNIRKTSKTASRSTTHKSIPDLLVKDISSLIEEARTHVAREYNSTQALLCWLIGCHLQNYSALLCNIKLHS